MGPGSEAPSSPTIAPMLPEGPASATSLVNSCLIFFPFTLFVYDWIITLGDEIEFIWSLRPRRKQLLFLALRYGTLFFMTLTVVSLFPSHKHGIRIKAWVREAVMCTIVITVHVILQLRIYIMYSRSRLILWTNAALFVAECAITAYLAFHFSSEIAPDPRDPCPTCIAFPRAFGFAYIAPLAFEAYLVFLAVRKNWIGRPHGTGRTLGVLIRGSVQYFALVASGLAIAMIMFAAAPKYALWVDLLTDATASIGGTRLIISVRRVLLHPPGSASRCERASSQQTLCPSQIV